MLEPAAACGNGKSENYPGFDHLDISCRILMLEGRCGGRSRARIRDLAPFPLESFWINQSIDEWGIMGAPPLCRQKLALQIDPRPHASSPRALVPRRLVAISTECVVYLCEMLFNFCALSHLSCSFVVCFEALDDDEGTKNGDLIILIG